MAPSIPKLVRTSRYPAEEEYRCETTMLKDKYTNKPYDHDDYSDEDCYKYCDVCPSECYCTNSPVGPARITSQVDLDFSLKFEKMKAKLAKQERRWKKLEEEDGKPEIMSEKNALKDLLLLKQAELRAKKEARDSSSCSSSSAAIPAVKNKVPPDVEGGEWKKPRSDESAQEFGILLPNSISCQTNETPLPRGITLPHYRTYATPETLFQAYVVRDGSHPKDGYCPVCNSIYCSCYTKSLVYVDINGKRWIDIEFAKNMKVTVPDEFCFTRFESSLDPYITKLRSELSERQQQRRRDAWLSINIPDIDAPIILPVSTTTSSVDVQTSSIAVPLKKEQPKGTG